MSQEEGVEDEQHKEGATQPSHAAWAGGPSYRFPAVVSGNLVLGIKSGSCIQLILDDEHIVTLTIFNKGGQRIGIEAPFDIKIRRIA